MTSPEPQHPCERCGTLTDEAELQVPPHLVDEFWCAECIHTTDPDEDEDEDNLEDEV